jgi:hypothetical protein
LSKNGLASWAKLSKVVARVTIVPGSPRIRFSSGIGRGVVVTIWRGLSPSLRPNCSMSQVASACFHLASSSHQAAEN